ncbi:MAG: hypothetical protein ACR2PG_10895 [Hyphomicrobiaceae bacterium]
MSPLPSAEAGWFSVDVSAREAAPDNPENYDGLVERNHLMQLTNSRTTDFDVAVQARQPIADASPQKDLLLKAAVKATAG